MLGFYAKVDLRFVWANLAPSERLFVLFFCCVAIYTCWHSLSVIFRIRTLKKQRTSGVATTSSANAKNLRKRLGNLRQLHVFTFYLLLFCATYNLPRAFEILGHFKTFPFGVILNQLTEFFYLYPPVLLVFLVLHSMQWFASAHVDSLERLETL